VTRESGQKKSTRSPTTYENRKSAMAVVTVCGEGLGRGVASKQKRGEKKDLPTQEGKKGQKRWGGGTKIGRGAPQMSVKKKKKGEGEDYS